MLIIMDNMGNNKGHPIGIILLCGRMIIVWMRFTRGIWFFLSLADEEVEAQKTGSNWCNLHNILKTIFVYFKVKTTEREEERQEKEASNFAHSPERARSGHSQELCLIPPHGHRTPHAEAVFYFIPKPLEGN